MFLSLIRILRIADIGLYPKPFVICYSAIYIIENLILSKFN